jgi:hypothetical protein
MKKYSLRLIGIGMAVLLLSGCSSSSTPETTTTTVVTPRQEDAFGTNFGASFRQTPNADPSVPAAGDITPLSLTTEPTAIAN